jgi:hypothetical protein
MRCPFELVIVLVLVLVLVLQEAECPPARHGKGRAFERMSALVRLQGYKKGPIRE